MIDDQDTQNNETQNSEETTSATSTDTSGTENSTTNETDKVDDVDKVDLGTGKQPAKDETQTEDTRTDEEKAADEERAKLFGAPEGDAKYEITGLPEGMAIDEKALAAIEPVARKLGLSSDGLSTIAQVYATDVLPGVAEQIVKGLNDDAVAKRTEWEGQARDAIAGKGEPMQNAAGDTLAFDGRSMGEVQKIAAKALDRLAPQGFREWLDETGLGVHPQMVAFAYQAGKAIAEDREVETGDTGRTKGKKGDGRPMTDASKFYERG